MNYTIFCVPKAWNGIDDIRQRNAIQSWCLLDPKPEIIFYYDDPGTEEAAREFGAKYITDMGRNQWGTPLINDIFELSHEKHATHDILGYINSDIIIGGTFTKALQLCSDAFPQFMMITRRWDIDIFDPIDFSDGWEERLREDVHKSGVLHRTGAIDFFFSRRGMWTRGAIRDFGIGRSAWDNWLCANAMYRKIPMIEVTDYVMVVHQDIPRGGPTRKEHNLTDERRKNKQMYYDDRKVFGYTGTNSEAPWVITAKGELKKRR